jgi:hypothetical protein
MINFPATGHHGEEAPTRDRLSPYRLLVYLLYLEDSPMVEPLGELKVRLFTAQAARHFNMRNAALWEQLFWLEDAKLIKKVDRERKRGTAIIQLVEVKRGK